MKYSDTIDLIHNMGTVLNGKGYYNIWERILQLSINSIIILLLPLNFQSWQKKVEHAWHKVLWKPWSSIVQCQKKSICTRWTIKPCYVIHNLTGTRLIQISEFISWEIWIDIETWKESYFGSCNAESSKYREWNSIEPSS